MKLVEFVLNENDADVGVFAISLVEDPAIEENFMYFSRSGKPQKFATLSDEKRIVMGAVMIPDMPILRVDAEGEKYNCFFSKETIRRVEELYMINSKHQSATLGHERAVNGVTLGFPMRHSVPYEDSRVATAPAPLVKSLSSVWSWPLW